MADLPRFTVEGILYALSDPVRAQIYAEMATSECPLNCSNFRKLDNRTLPKATLSQHFKILGSLWLQGQFFVGAVGGTPQRA